MNGPFNGKFIYPEITFAEALEDVSGLGHCIILQYSGTLADYMAVNRITGSERRAIIEQVLQHSTVC